MRARIIETIVALALTLTLGGLPRAALGEEPKPQGEKKEEGAPRQGAVVDPATGKRLNEAVEHLHAQRYAEAKAALSKLNLERLSPYELSRAEQLFAAVEQAQGNYGAAREHLNKAIASGGLNDQEISTARFQLAQLFITESRWKEGVEALKQWFATAQNPNSAAYHLLAIAYYQMGDHNSALEPAQKAVDLSGGKAQESWLQLLLAIRLERKEYAQAVPLLKQLIEAGPTKKTYWLQLAGVQASLGGFESAVVPTELAYRAGLLTEDQDLTRLAQMLLQISIPYRAAQILGQAIDQGKIKPDAKTFELLANCWVAAREYEKAIQPLRKAADLAENGELYVRLAEVYVQKEAWGDAAGVLRLAFDKGKIKNPGNAQLLMGLATYNQKKSTEARTWFQRASEHPESRSQAEAWMRHVDHDLESEPRAETGKEAPPGKS